MPLALLALAAVASLTTGAPVTDTLPVFPLVDVVNHGYDRLAGAPIVAPDPGWRLAPVFDVACASCFSQQNVLDGKYLLPDSVTVDHSSSCSYDTITSVVRDGIDYQKSFSSSVAFQDAELPVLKGLEFTGSKHFHATLNASLEEELAFVYSRATCGVYELQRNMFEHNPPLSDAFKAALLTLPGAILKHDLKALFTFVQTFGTHVVSSVTVGGSATQANAVSVTNLTVLESAGVDLEAAAQRSLWIFFGAQLSDSSSTSAQAYEQLIVSLSDNTTHCSPSCPPAQPNVNLDSSAWTEALSLPNLTVPIHAELVPITSLLKHIMSTDAHGAELRAAASNVSDAVDEFLSLHYCGMTEGCAAPKPVPHWLPAPPLLTPRTGAVGGVLGDTIFVVGGATSDNNPSAIVESLDVTGPEQEWTSRPFLNHARSAPAGGVLPSLGLVVTGGTTSNTKASNLVEIFSPKTLAWSAGPSMLQNRTGHTTVVLGNSLYVFGGQNATMTVASAEVFNGTSWSALAPMPVAVSRAAVAVLPGNMQTVLPGNSIVLVGGATDNGVVNTVQVFNTATNTWTTSTSLPFSVGGPQAFVRNESGVPVVAVFGGYQLDGKGNQLPSNALFEFDASTAVWVSRSRPLVPVPYAATACINSTGFTFGGTSVGTGVIGKGSVAVGFCADSNTASTAVRALGRPQQQQPPVLRARPSRPIINANRVAVTSRARSRRADADLPAIPNIQEVGRGIDMQQSNPDAMAQNPALRQQIFDLNCANCYSQGQTFDEQFKVPDFISARPARDCSYDADVSEIHSTLDLQKHFSFYFKSKKCFLWFCSSHTEEFNEVEEMTSNLDYVFVKAKATCSSYIAELQQNTPGVSTMLSQNFVDAVNELPETFVPGSTSQETLYEFVSTFGTHYITQATLGGSAVQTSTFNQTSFTHLKSESSNLNSVQYGAMMAFMNAFGAPPMPNDHNYNSYQKFQSTVLTQKTAYMPEAPPRGTDVSKTGETWLKQVADAPGLVACVTENITTLLTPNFFDASVIPPSTLANKQSALLSYLMSPQGYCKDTGACKAATAAMVWRQQPAMVRPRAAAAARSLNGSVFFLGGAEIGTTANPSSALQFDLAGGNWTLIPPKPFNATTVGAGSAVLASTGEIFSLGGHFQGDCTSNVAKYNPAKKLWIAVQHLNTGRCNLVSEAVGNHVYAIGGSDVKGNIIGTVERYTPDTNMWDQVTSMLTPRAAMSSVVYNQEIYTFGGMVGQSTVSAAIEIYNPAADQWRSTSPIPASSTPRFAHQSVLFPSIQGNPAMWILGGTVDGQASLADTQIYDITLASWLQGPPMPAGSKYGSAFVFKSSSADLPKLHFFGGYDDSNNVLDTHVTLATGDDNTTWLDAPAAPRTLAQRFVQRPRKAALRVAAGATDAEVLPGVSYLGLGYNMVTGNPTSGLAASTGWAIQRVFDPLCGNCSVTKTMAGGRYLVPDGLSVQLSPACTMNTKTAVITDAVAMQEWLREGISLSGHAGIPLLLNFHFSANVEFQQHISKSLKDQSVTVAAAATCESHRVGFDPYAYKPQLTESFVTAVQNLPATLEDQAALSAYADFVNTFGTHVPTQLALGGRAGVHNTLSTMSYTSLQEVDANLDACASAHFLFFFGMKAEEGGSIHYSRYQQLNQSSDDTATFCTPSCPNELAHPQYNTSAWAAQVQLGLGQPVPVAADFSHAVSDFAKLVDPAIGANVELFLNQSYCSQVPGCAAVAAKAQHATKLPNLNLARIQAEAIPVDNVSAIIVGGRADLSSERIQVVSAPLDARWGYAGNTLSSRSAAASALMSGRGVLAGGFDTTNGNALPTVECFSQDAWYQCPSLPDPRFGAASAVNGDALYLFFGATGAINAPTGWSQATWFFASNSSWTNGTGVVTSGPRLHAAATFAGGKGYIFGGQVPGGASLDEIVMYDPAIDRYTVLQARLPRPSYGHAAVTVNGKVYVAGGMVTDVAGNQAAISTVYEFDPVTQNFVVANNLPKPLAQFAYTTFGNTLFLFGGINCPSCSASTDVTSIILA